MGKGRKRKRKENYYVVTISDNPKASTHAMRMTQGSRYFWSVVISALLVVLVFFVALLNYRNSVLNGKEAVYIATVESLQSEIDRLSAENATLTDKVKILSDTVYEKSVVVDAIVERSIPSGFPLSVAADFSEKEIEVKMDGDKVICPTIEFAAKNGTFVLAPGDGKVLRVVDEGNDIWNIEIDHGNGYVTFYEMPSKPKVRDGDEVAKGGPLCELKSSDKSPTVVYKMTYNGEYINPGELLSIDG
ncbi:MAG: peptidoglycan DD-metalloendopeptidase family protein [Lachnospiraceae bacterium]|nr:peptidoglycan DD-metalloendopeptidase family protein [Candidatus Colinaster scatohippi]